MQAAAEAAHLLNFSYVFHMVIHMKMPAAETGPEGHARSGQFISHLEFASYKSAMRGQISIETRQALS